MRPSFDSFQHAACRDCCSRFPALICHFHHYLTAACRVSCLRRAYYSPHMQPCAVHQQAPGCCLQRVLSAVGLSKAQPGSKRKAESDEPADAPAPAAAAGVDAGGPPEAALEEPTAAPRPRGRPRKRQRRTASPPVQASSSLAHLIRFPPGGTTQESTQVPEQRCLLASTGGLPAGKPGSGVLHAAGKHLCKHKR